MCSFYFCRQVVLAADVSRSFETDTYPLEDEGAMYLKGLSLEGAMWDTEKNGLREANMRCGSKAPLGLVQRHKFC